MRPPVGSRVLLAHAIDRYPHFVAPAGAAGTVVDIGDPNIYAVRLDELLEGAEDWSNEVHWILDTGDTPDDELEYELHVFAGMAGYGVPDPRDPKADYLADGYDTETAALEAARRALAFPPVLDDDDRAQLAEALEDYAAGVEENLADDGVHDAPVVEDYRADAERIRAGEAPLHELTREVLADPTGPSALVDEPARYLELVGMLAPSSSPDSRRAAEHEAELRGDADVERAYEVASADVVLPLSAREAGTIAGALELLADLDEGEHVDDDELRRLAALVRSHVPADRVAAVLAVLEAAGTTPAQLDGNPTRALEAVNAADRALSKLPGYIGSVPEGRRFVADVLADTALEGGRQGLAEWLVAELTAE